MSRIGDNAPRPLRTTGEASAAHPGATSVPLASTEVEPGETSLAQVAERLQLLADLLTQLNPLLAQQPVLETGQTVLYPKNAMAEAFAAGSSAAASRRNDALFDAMQNRQMVNQGSAAALRTIPPFDPASGPQITNDMWTDEMLGGELTENQLRNIVDPAAFLNARHAFRTRPTEAVWVSSITGATTAVNPSQMATQDEADAMLARLRALGYSGPGVHEMRPENPFSRIDYGSDPRRHWMIGDFNVGLLLERYARYPREEADRQMAAEMRAAGI